jgi:hypothetical protein
LQPRDPIGKELSQQSREKLERDLKEGRTIVEQVESKLRKRCGTYESLKKEGDELHSRREAIKLLSNEFKDERPTSRSR